MEIQSSYFITNTSKEIRVFTQFPLGAICIFHHSQCSQILQVIIKEHHIE